MTMTPSEPVSDMAANRPVTGPVASPVPGPVAGPVTGPGAQGPAGPATAGGAPTGADPFAPQGVVFTPVSPRLITARLLGAACTNLVLAVAGIALGVTVSRWFLLVVGLAVVQQLWMMWLIPRQVRAMGYHLGEDHLLWRRGVMFRSVSVVPYGRMQYVDTSQGPLARYLGIAEVKLHTASVGTDATINGLPVQEAEHLRQVLSQRGEERMAGL